MATDDDTNAPRPGRPRPGTAPDLDELDREPIPEPDDEPSPSERIRARGFADVIDKVVAGRPPAAMSADDRALAEVATAIRAASGAVVLAAARRDAIVESALRRAIAETTAPQRRAESDAPHVAASRPRRWRQAAPWAIAAASTAMAAAAALALWVRPAPSAPGPIAVRELPEHQRSRPADALVGRIPREHAGDAAARLDTIYADRLAGFRERAFDAPRAQPRRSR
jgi:hypothetical protein